jgi:hypothetical protein
MNTTTDNKPGMNTCQRCGHPIIIGKCKTQRGTMERLSCFCGDALDDWCLLTDNQKMTRAANSMIHFLEPDELERFSDAERIEKETEAEIQRLIDSASERKPLTDWRDARSPEEDEILAKFSPEWRDAIEQLHPEEMQRFAALHQQLGNAQHTQAELMRLAAERES